MPLALTLELLDPPLLALVALGLLPVAAGVVTLRRSREATRTLGLAPGALPPAFAAPAAAALACVFAALAAAQPVVRTVEERSGRTDSEVVFLVDVSRSMLASAAPDAETRLARARDVVATLRRSIRDVPSGLAGLTDRALPYLFPTDDGDVFTRTLRQSVRDETPPPGEINRVATTFAPLSGLERDGVFTPRTTYRTCVLVTDGEARTGGEETGFDSGLPDLSASTETALSGRFGDQSLSGAALARTRACRLIVVRVGSASDRIYVGAGRPEPEYRPDPASASKVSRLADAAGGAAFGDGDLDRVVRALREDAERGPVAAVQRESTSDGLAPLAAGVAAILAVGVGIGRTARRNPATTRSRGLGSRRYPSGGRA